MSAINPAAGQSSVGRLREALDGVLAEHAPTTEGASVRVAATAAGLGFVDTARALLAQLDDFEAARAAAEAPPPEPLSPEAARVRLGQVLASVAKAQTGTHVLDRALGALSDAHVDALSPRVDVLSTLVAELQALSAEVRGAQTEYSTASTAELDARDALSVARTALASRLPTVPERDWLTATEDEGRRRLPAFRKPLPLQVFQLAYRQALDTATQARDRFQTAREALRGLETRDKALSAQLATTQKALLEAMMGFAALDTRLRARLDQRDQLDTLLPHLVATLERGRPADIREALKYARVPSASDVHAPLSTPLKDLTLLVCQLRQGANGAQYEPLLDALGKAWAATVADPTCAHADVVALFAGEEVSDLGSGAEVRVNIFSAPTTQRCANAVLDAYVALVDSGARKDPLRDLLRPILQATVRACDVSALEEPLPFVPDALKRRNAGPEIWQVFTEASTRGEFLVALARIPVPLTYDQRNLSKEAQLYVAIEPRLSDAVAATYRDRYFGPDAPRDSTLLANISLSERTEATPARAEMWVHAEALETQPVESFRRLLEVSKRLPLVILTTRDRDTVEARLKREAQALGKPEAFEVRSMDTARGQPVQSWYGGGPPGVHGIAARDPGLVADIAGWDMKGT